MHRARMMVFFWTTAFILVQITLQKYFVGNKAKGRISKQVFQENQARQIFRKTNNTLMRKKI